MKAIIYVIRFEPELGFRDIALYLKKIESPIRLEVGDKIALSFASFDRSLEDDKDYIHQNIEHLLKFQI
jgi:FKBP-type peptidyl-prolyl cis-trans isomerase (trigger factor)